MTDGHGLDPDQEREVPEGTKRKHLRTFGPVHGYTKERAGENEVTMSRQLNAWMPDNYEDIEFGYEDDDIAHWKVTPDTKERVRSMTGSNVAQGDVVALFVTLAAVRNGDLEAAEDIMPYIGEPLWGLLNSFTNDLLKLNQVEDQ